MGTILTALVVIVLAIRTGDWGGALALGLFTSWHAGELLVAFFLAKHAKDKEENKHEDTP